MVVYCGCVKIFEGSNKNICFIKGCNVSVYYHTRLIQIETVETKSVRTVKGRYFLFFFCDVG